MQTIADSLAIAVAVLIAIPVGVFCLQVFAAIPRRRRKLARRPGPGPSTVVLIPAHDEQQVLGETLRRLTGTLTEAQRVLVVADNCMDATAEIARAWGVEVVERQDRSQTGKGYALAFGTCHLRACPPEVVVVIDADCHVSRHFVTTIADRACASGRPVQSLNLSQFDPHAGGGHGIAILANRFVNYIRPVGQRRLRMPCRLMGTGMALPWTLAEQADWGGGNLVEDMQLGIDLAAAGHAPLFCDTARVTSRLPDGREAFVSQRTRWEHGHLQTALHEIPRLIVRAITARCPSLLWIALDLSVPPLTLLTCLLTVAAISATAYGLAGLSWIPALILGAAGAAFGLALLIGWFAYCRHLVRPAALGAVPSFVIRKLGIYGRFLWRRQHGWVRTDRASRGTEEVA